MKNLIKHLQESLRIGLNDKPTELDFSGCPENRDQLEAYLIANDYKYTVEDKGQYDNSYDIHVETKYPGVIAHYYFIGESEYIFEITKNDKKIYGKDSTFNLHSYNPIDALKLDPFKFFNDNLKTYQKKLASAQKGKLNRRTGERETNYSEISMYERKVKYFENCLQNLK